MNEIKVLVFGIFVYVMSVCVLLSEWSHFTVILVSFFTL